MAASSLEVSLLRRGGRRSKQPRDVDHARPLARLGAGGAVIALDPGGEATAQIGDQSEHFGSVASAKEQRPRVRGRAAGKIEDAHWEFVPPFLLRIPAKCKRARDRFSLQVVHKTTMALSTVIEDNLGKKSESSRVRGGKRRPDALRD